MQGPQQGPEQGGTFRWLIHLWVPRRQGPLPCAQQSLPASHLLSPPELLGHPVLSHVYVIPGFLSSFPLSGRWLLPRGPVLVTSTEQLP